MLQLDQKRKICSNFPIFAKHPKRKTYFGNWKTTVWTYRQDSGILLCQETNSAKVIFLNPLTPNQLSLDLKYLIPCIPTGKSHIFHQLTTLAFIISVICYLFQWMFQILSLYIVSNLCRSILKLGQNYLHITLNQFEYMTVNYGQLVNKQIN